MAALVFLCYSTSAACFFSFGTLIYCYTILPVDMPIFGRSERSKGAIYQMGWGWGRFPLTGRYGRGHPFLLRRFSDYCNWPVDVCTHTPTHSRMYHIHHIHHMHHMHKCLQEDDESLFWFCKHSESTIQFRFGWSIAKNLLNKLDTYRCRRMENFLQSQVDFAFIIKILTYDF